MGDTPRWPGAQQDHPDSYRAQLSSPPFDQMNVLITEHPALARRGAPVTQEYVESAAQSLGFALVRAVRLPDGREARIWWLNRGPRR